MSAFLNGNLSHGDNVLSHTYYILCQHEIKIVIIKCGFDWTRSGIVLGLNSFGRGLLRFSLFPNHMCSFESIL